jgi:hypothetical protein
MRSYTAYSVPFPSIPDNSYNFSFLVNGPDGLYTFYFNYNKNDVEGNTSDSWYFTAILPSGEVRWGRLNPNAIIWSGHTDVSLYFETSLTSIGQNDLGSISMFMYYWGST